jgi:hypothetical protein
MVWSAAGTLLGDSPPGSEGAIPDADLKVDASPVTQGRFFTTSGHAATPEAYWPLKLLQASCRADHHFMHEPQMFLGPVKRVLTVYRTTTASR